MWGKVFVIEEVAERARGFRCTRTISFVLNLLVFLVIINLHSYRAPRSLDSLILIFHKKKKKKKGKNDFTKNYPESSLNPRSEENWLFYKHPWNNSIALGAAPNLNCITEKRTVRRGKIISLCGAHLQPVKKTTTETKDKKIETECVQLGGVITPDAALTTARYNDSREILFRTS